MSAMGPCALARVASALQFARLGCRIAPAAGKNPGGYLGKAWQHKASRDPDLITAWWEAWPAANVAIIPDRALLPVDVDDTRNFVAFQVAHGGAPRTPRYLSGGDGGRERLLFAFPGDAALEHADRKLTTGVQLRYSHRTALVCIVPPGRNPDTGRDLKWTVGLDEAPLAPIPPAWLERITAVAGRKGADHWANIASQKVAKDHRHETMLQLAGYLMARLRNGELVLALMQAWNKCHCVPPKDAAEVESIVAWVAKREAGLT